MTWRRCVDMNDRQLRFIVDGLGAGSIEVPREDGYGHHRGFGGNGRLLPGKGSG